MGMNRSELMDKFLLGLMSIDPERLESSKIKINYRDEFIIGTIKDRGMRRLLGFIWLLNKILEDEIESNSEEIEKINFFIETAWNNFQKFAEKEFPVIREFDDTYEFGFREGWTMVIVSKSPNRNLFLGSS